jgi:hypothetical protein
MGVAVAMAVSACGWLANNPTAPTSTAPNTAQVAPASALPAVEAPAILVGAGDIALCGPASEATARLLDSIPGSVFTAGDNTYPTGSMENFANCYEPTWGRHKARTYPAPGNHEYEVAGAAPYFAYFGAAAGPPGLGYYSYDAGPWHVLSLNSNISAQPGSAQYEWVKSDLAARSRVCTLAYWHFPVFSSGPNGNIAAMREMWRLLDQADVDVVIVGHDHDYERFAPQDADGRPDPRGIREFVAGTGGGPLYQQKVVQPNSQVRESNTWGVLKLTLRSTGYDWEFVPVDGQTFRDSGSADCIK